MSDPELLPLKLLYKAKDQALSTIVEPTGVTIGRKAGCDIVLSSFDVSRQHAQIRAERGRWILRDLGSSNGTLVDGVQITEHELQHGECIRIGEFDLLCQFESTMIDPEDAEAEACLDMRDFNVLVDQVLEDRAEPKTGKLGGTHLVLPRAQAARPA